MARFIQKLWGSQMSRRAVLALECAMIVMVIAVAGLGAASTSGQDLSSSASKVASVF